MGILDTEFEALREPNSPEEISREEASARRRYVGPWIRRWNFAQKVLGAEEVLEGPPLTIVYEEPYAYPDAPWLYATRCSVEGSGASFEDPEHPFEIAFDEAIVTVEFETWKFDPSDEEFLTVELDGASEFLTVEGGQLFASGQRVPGPTPILIPQIDFTISAHRITEIRDAWFSLVGHVNDAVWRGRPAGTVLFRPSRARAQRSISGETRYEATLAFSYRRIPWNEVWNPYEGQFETVTATGTGTLNYPEGNLALVAPAV